MVKDISPKDKIENKDIWLLDTKNNDKVSIGWKNYGTIIYNANTKSFNNIEIWETALTGSTDDENELRISGLKTGLVMRIRSLGKVSSSLHYKKVREKESMIYNNCIRSTRFGISSEGKIGSSLHYERHLQRCQGISKALPTCFYIKSSILLW